MLSKLANEPKQAMTEYNFSIHFIIIYIFMGTSYNGPLPCYLPTCSLICAQFLGMWVSHPGPAASTEALTGTDHHQRSATVKDAVLA